MFAVIFRAEILAADAEYGALAEELRHLALSQYGCREFTACREGNREIAISYWDNEADIRAWKQEQRHLAAQANGQARWYKSYNVQVVEVQREYSFPE